MTAQEHREKQQIGAGKIHGQRNEFKRLPENSALTRYVACRVML